MPMKAPVFPLVAADTMPPQKQILIYYIKIHVDLFHTFL